MDEEIVDYQRRAEYWELLYLRAREGAQAANRGIQRLQNGYDRLKLDLLVAEAQVGRLHRDNAELEKKVQRLSLKLLGEWGRK